MTINSKTLRVYPNPWGTNIYRSDEELKRNADCTLDANCLPANAVLHEPRHEQRFAFVGAVIDSDRTKVLEVKKRGDDIASPEQLTVFSFLGIPATDPDLAAKLAAQEPVEVANRDYYRHLVKEGNLIPADRLSAHCCRVPFMEPAGAFHRSHEYAQIAFELLNGKERAALLREVASAYLAAPKPKNPKAETQPQDQQPSGGEKKTKKGE